MYDVLLARHGASQSNVGCRTSDPKDVELIPQGQREAKQIANLLEIYAPFDRLDLIVTSSYKRAWQTAEYTKALFPYAPLKEWRVEEFTYLTSIHQECLTTEERRPMVDAYWEQLLPDYVEGPASESFRVFINRVYEFIERLHDPTYQTAVIFTHELFINALRWLIDKQPCEEISSKEMQSYRNYFNQNRIPNGGLIHLKMDPDLHYEVITEHLKRPVEEHPEWRCLENQLEWRCLQEKAVAGQVATL